MPSTVDTPNSLELIHAEKDPLAPQIRPDMTFVMTAREQWRHFKSCSDPGASSGRYEDLARGLQTVESREQLVQSSAQNVFRADHSRPDVDDSAYDRIHLDLHRGRGRVRWPGDRLQSSRREQVRIVAPGALRPPRGLAPRSPDRPSELSGCCVSTLSLSRVVRAEEVEKRVEAERAPLVPPDCLRRNSRATRPRTSDEVTSPP